MSESKVYVEVNHLENGDTVVTITIKDAKAAILDEFYANEYEDEETNTIRTHEEAKRLFDKSTVDADPQVNPLSVEPIVDLLKLAVSRRRRGDDDPERWW